MSGGLINEAESWKFRDLARRAAWAGVNNVCGYASDKAKDEKVADALVEGAENAHGSVSPVTRRALVRRTSGSRVMGLMLCSARGAVSLSGVDADKLSLLFVVGGAAVRDCIIL